MSAEPRWRRMEPDERRRQILSCAVRLFAELPYDDVSTGDVAREAGVARGLINHYFGTKKDLFLEVVRVMVTVPDEALLQLPAGDLPTRVSASVTWFLDAVSRHAKPWLVAVGATGWPRDADVSHLIAEADESTADAILRAIATDPGSAGPAAEELRAATRAFVGFARTAAVEWLVRGSLTRDQVHVLLTRTLVTLAQDTYPALPPRR